MKTFFVFLLTLVSLGCDAQDIRVHDPVMIKEGNTYYLFCTGQGISVFTSTDLKNWKPAKPVFGKAPEWAVTTIPNFKGHIWAPDIVHHNGIYYLYYSVSAFGKNTSCIGVASNTTVNAEDKNYKWVDHGKVIQSVPGRDLWNAIDPNVAFDENQQPWMVFGSFWSAIKLVKLDSSMVSVSQPEEWHSVSKRPRDYKVADESPEPGAVEAPFIFKHVGYYYLFLSFDYCCRGKESTYKIVVGRSKDIKGPYVDKNNTPLNENGGSLVLQGDERWAGLGHNSVYTFDGNDYIVFHAYDSNDGGKPKLRIEKLTWDEHGWPMVNMSPTK
jgi:arabinan endo-1,5-alpha-L-arabinosidase